jgi:hypothetical protein
MAVTVCDECHGAGGHGYESGPPFERCPRCHGAGVLFGPGEPPLQQLAATLFGSRGAELQLNLGEGGLIRALTVAAADLEQRVVALERELAKLL